MKLKYLLINHKMSNPTGNHGWHIHELPIDQTVSPDLQCLSSWAGPHYDPLNARANLNYATDCSTSNPSRLVMFFTHKLLFHVYTYTSCLFCFVWLLFVFCCLSLCFLSLFSFFFAFPLPSRPHSIFLPPSPTLSLPPPVVRQVIWLAD